MKGRSKGSALHIRDDELEHHRAQLERNLQNTEPSFHILSTDDDEDDANSRRRRQNHSSVEYPRHISEPSLPEFPSFALHRSRDFADDNDRSHMDRSQMHAWSYRTGDDDDGINPYGGETVSTVAHHASAVTISAGLGGGRGARNREPSLSGAEYDPDRPLHAMIAGVNSKHSMFDMESKNPAMASMTYDPVVVDSTAELDRLLESGHAPPPSMRSRSVRLTSPIISSASSSASDSEAAPEPSRPKLSDHLRHVSFSPKRPRSAQGHISNVSATGSPLSRSSRQPAESLNFNASMIDTPRPTRRSNIFPSHASTPAQQQPEVRLHPATPSTTGSKFTRMARGINKELEATQQQIATSKPPTARPASIPLHHAERNPFYESAEPAPSFRNPTPRKSSMRDTTKSRIHLPDVTGLTNAVESPLKPGTQYYPYPANNRPRDSEARLLQTLSTVQAQLHDLDQENSISRRRVRELEMELEECKRNVARERTRLIEREDIMNISRVHPGDISYQRAGGSRVQGKSRARDTSVRTELDDERLHARYKEAVDEKKALEALINSLRSHLTRLTSELASHQSLLTELRQLRDQDALALHEKSTQITQLKEQVQRLAGEVEVLRGVVEEGLKERRASKENIQVELSQADMGMSQDLQDEEESDGEYQPEQDDEEVAESSLGDDTEEEADPASFQAADKTMRTDHATLGSTNLAESTNTNTNSVRLVNAEELSRIAAEVEERRSNRSNGSIASLRKSRSPSPVKSIGRRATVEELNDEAPLLPSRQAARPQPEPSTSRPAIPISRTHNLSSRERNPPTADPETPFPQIRGEQLERLFFSAPEHNAKTCTVCHRRRNRPSSPSWSRPHTAGGHRSQPAQHHHDAAGQDDDDEGYEGSEDADERGGVKGKQREHVTFSHDPAHWRQAGRKQGLPPQTVVARVIRELEDDFTHYKSVYCELADQYKVMDAISDVRRRNTLAQHLREVVDILEQKGDQIASLYDLLSFKDKPIPEPTPSETTTRRRRLS